MRESGIGQKVLALLLILAIPLFILTNLTILRSKRDLSAKISSDFIPANDYLAEKSFVFILYSPTEDPKGYSQNLTSIFGQNYDNYRVIFILTENIESHRDEIKQFAAKENREHLLTLLASDEKEPTIASFKKAIDTCKNEEIVIHMECNDWIAHENVLAVLNQTYTNSEDVWLTYSQYIEYPSYRKWARDPHLKRLLRNRNNNKAPWVSSHFKTYYAGLFKQIELDDKFSYRRPLNQSTLDLYMLPMAESSKNHIEYIEEILYVHNSNNT